MILNSCEALDTSWCAVVYILLSLSALLLILTVLLYISLYKRMGILSRSQNLVFTGQFLQTSAMAFHYAFLGNDFNIIFLLQEYLLSVQYSLVFYYFLGQLTENLKNLRRIRVPLTILNVIMMIGFLIYVSVLVILNETLYNCNNGIWVYLHSCGIILSIIFVGLGYQANKSLKAIKANLHITVDSKKIKHFWVIIISMLVASIANIAESLYYIDINNQSCYNSYASNEYLDIAVFLTIRFLSHYLFLISCLYIFQVEKVQNEVSELNSEGSFKQEKIFEEYTENSWAGASSSFRLS